MTLAARADARREDHEGCHALRLARRAHEAAVDGHRGRVGTPGAKP